MSNADASKPLIFISHDHKDVDLAKAFSQLLIDASMGALETFWSSDPTGNRGIPYGTEWYPTLMEKLEQASEIVCLWTARSLGRPWMLYEAGVAKGKAQKTVTGVALGINMNKIKSGPFAQIQNCDDKEDALIQLVNQLIKRNTGLEPTADRTRPYVKVFKETPADDPNGDGLQVPSGHLYVYVEDFRARVEKHLDRTPGDLYIYNVEGNTFEPTTESKNFWNFLAHHPHTKSIKIVISPATFRRLEGFLHDPAWRDNVVAMLGKVRIVPATIERGHRRLAFAQFVPTSKSAPARSWTFPKTPLLLSVSETFELSRKICRPWPLDV